MAVMTYPHVHVRSEEREGRVSIVETTPGPGAGPLLHHHDFDEAFYAGPGDLVFAPAGVPHTFANLSGAPARQLITCTPAGFERYFARLAAEREGVEPPEWALQPTPEVVRVGPPIEPAA
jgi:uncharacterized RmlC-like cupin family protein